MEPSIIAGIGLLVVLVLMSVFAASMYRRCPPNAAMLISGMYAGTDAGPGLKIVVGGGGAVVLPMIQAVHYLSLEPTPVEVSQTFNAAGDAQVEITIKAQVAVNKDVQSIAIAAERLLGKEPEEVQHMVRDIIVGHVNGLLATTTPQELLQAVDSFATTLQKVTTFDLGKTGLAVVTLHVTSIEPR